MANKKYVINCYRCGIECKHVRQYGYCSKKCMYEAMSERMKNEYDSGLRYVVEYGSRREKFS